MSLLNIHWRPLKWTKALTSYYTESRRLSADLVGFGPVRVSHVEKHELDQICRHKAIKTKNHSKIFFESFFLLTFALECYIML